MGRLTSQEQDALYRAIADFVYNKQSEVTNESGKVSTTKLQRRLKEFYGIDVKLQSLTNILKKNLKPYIEKRPTSDSNIKDLEAALGAAKGIINDPETKPTAKNGAMNAYSNLMKTKLAWEKQLMEIKLQEAEKDRPIYKVRFGHFKSVESKCPKCGHKFYDIPGQKKDEEKKPFIKADEKQDTIKGVD